MREKVVHVLGESERAVEKELAEALHAIRVGDYDSAAKTLARPTLRDLRERGTSGNWSDVNGLRFVTLSAEILDREAKYKRAAALLRKYTQSLGRELEAEAERNLRRQQLYCAVQIAVMLYRARKLDEAQDLLTKATRAANAMQPPSEGLSTQLDYALAKLHLRRGDFREATMLFRRSADSASRRFNRYVHKGTGANTDEKRRTELGAARYSVGKSMCLGLGQCLIEQSLLDEARTVITAGLLILDSTTDLIHRHYARLLLGIAEHASAASGDTELLTSARQHLRDAVSFFRKRRPTLSYRARCELALVELKLSGSFAAARKIVQQVATLKSERRRRWKAQALITLAHISIHEGAHAEGIRLAHQASNVVFGDVDAEMVDMEARITLAQAFDASVRARPGDSNLMAAEHHIRRVVRDLSDGPIQQRALMLLLLARMSMRRENIRSALSAYQNFTRIASLVQSRRIEELAKAVREELFPKGPPLRLPMDDETASYGRDENLQAFRQYLARAVKDRHPESTETELSVLLGGKHFYPRLVALAWPRRSRVRRARV